MKSIPEEPQNVIYGLKCLCHPGDGVRYVGQTSRGMTQRIYFHLWESRTLAPSNHGYNLPSKRWIRKHGERNISYEILEVLDNAEELDHAEIKWIAHYKTFGRGESLNLNVGGSTQRGYVHTEETRAKLSEARRLRPSNKGTYRLPQFAGENNSQAVLTEAQVVEIKFRFWNGEMLTNIAMDYPVSISVISKIGTGESWDQVPWPIGPRRQSQTTAHRSAQSKGPGNPNFGKYLTEEQKRAMSMSRSMFNEDQIREIRRLREEDGLTGQQIAATMGSSPSNINFIASRKRFPWII